MLVVSFGILLKLSRQTYSVVRLDLKELQSGIGLLNLFFGLASYGFDLL